MLVCCRIFLYSEDEVKVQLKPCLLMQKRDPRTERGLRYVCAERDACGELGKSLVISRLLSLPCSALCSLFRLTSSQLVSMRGAKGQEHGRL